MASRAYSRTKRWKKPKTLSERWEGWFPSPHEDDIQPRNKRGRVTGPSKNERLAIEEQRREQAVFDQIQAKKAKTETHLKAFETGALTDYDIAKEDLGHIFQRLVENPNMTDQQRTRLIKAGLLVENSVFDEDTQETSYTYQSGYGKVDFLNTKKDEEFINQTNEANGNDGGKPGIEVAHNQTKFNQTGGGVSGANPPILNNSKDQQPKEKEKEPDLTIGSKPWARKWAGGDGTSYRDANAATEELLTKEGWDLRGLGIAQKQDLFSDYRTGRLPKTDTSIFFNNKRIKKR